MLSRIQTFLIYSYQKVTTNNMQEVTSQQLIQVLLFEGGSMKKVDLAKFFDIEKEILESKIEEIEKLLAPLELKLVRNATTLEITLSEEMSSLINKNKIEELKTELSESSLQTLAVILYKNKTTKPEIDFIRGVDSGRSIKNLLTRGIIEKLEEKNRRYYLPTTETLRYLNLNTQENLVDFNEISAKLKELIEGEN